MRRKSAPPREAVAGGRKRPIQVVGRCVRQLSDHLFGGWIDDRRDVPAGARHPLTADEKVQIRVSRA